MASLAAIYKISADITGLQRSVDQGIGVMQKLEGSTSGVDNKLGTMIGTVGKLGAAVGIGFSVGAVVSFGKELLGTADSLLKLHDRTGVSLQGLQRFQVVSDETSVTLESMAKGVNKVQDLLLSGDKSFHAALVRVGLDVEEFRQLKPEAMYIAISDALRQVADPAERTNLAIDLMGKLGAENLPALMRGFDDLKDSAPGMSDEAIKALDATGDAIARLWRGTKNAIGETAGDAINAIMRSSVVQSGSTLLAWYRTFTDSNEALEAAVKKVPPPVRDLAAAYKPLTLTTAEQARIEKDLSLKLKDTTEAHKRQTDAVNKAADAQKRFLESVHAATDRLTGGTLALHKYIAAIPGATMGTGKLSDEILNLTSRSLDLEDVLVKQMPEGMGYTRGALDLTGEAVRSLGDKITGHLTTALQGIPQIFIDAFTGGGGVIGALKGIGVSLLNAIVKEILDPLMATIAGYVSKGIGMLTGLFGFQMPSFGAAAAGAAAAGGTAAGAGGAAAGGGGGLLAGLAGALPVLGPIAAALPMIIGGLNLPTTENTLGGFINGQQVTMQEAIDYYNRNPDQLQLDFAKNNPDLAAAYAAEAAGYDIGDRRLFDPDSMLNFNTGTGGQFVDFGSGTPVTLHGKERVVTETEGRRDAQDLAALAARIGDLQRYMETRFASDIAKAQAVANAKAGIRG